ncbi:MAG TPA: hypothetical protein VFS55_15265 [Dokdonella sp.]|nr:hypothetical protein [Dokdonella sp.]
MTLDHPLLLALGIAASAAGVPCSRVCRDAHGAPGATVDGPLHAEAIAVAPPTCDAFALRRTDDAQTDAVREPRGAPAMHASHDAATARAGFGNVGTHGRPHAAASGCLACHGRPASTPLAGGRPTAAPQD